MSLARTEAIMTDCTKKVVRRLTRVLKVFTEDQEADASVALLLRMVNQSLEVLLVRRVENRSDPWSGQIALPGGKRIPEDENLMKTVVRETFEETRVNLLEGCQFLGVMDVLESAARPGMKVLPFTILLEREQPIRLCKAELEWSSWTRLEELAKHRGTANFTFGDFPAYIVHRNVVWGLTYRIIENLFHALREL